MEDREHVNLSFAFLEHSPLRDQIEVLQAVHSPHR